MVNLDDLDVNFYYYTPSVAAAAVFIAVFTTATIAHAIYAWRTGCKYFIPLILGGVCEIIAFIIRAGASKYLTLIAPFIIQELFMLLAPIFFAATIYMVLSRLIRAVQAEHLSPLRPKILARCFVIADLLCLSVQGNGGSLEAKDSDKVRKIGQYIVVVGLVLQIIAFVGFLYIAWRFQRRLKAQPTPRSEGTAIKWKQCMAVLYAVSALVIVRNLERTVEHAEGTDGWLTTHEPMLMCFDATPMSLLMIILLIWHPTRLLGPIPAARSSESQGSDIEMLSVDDENAAGNMKKGAPVWYWGLFVWSMGLVSLWRTPGSFKRGRPQRDRARS